AAIRTCEFVSLISTAHHLLIIGETPFTHIDFVIQAGEHAAAADSCLWWRKLPLVRQAVEKLVHQPGRHAFALAEIDEAEIEQMDEEHLPMCLQELLEPLPVYPLVGTQDEMGHVGAVIAVAVLDEELRPDQLGRSHQPHGMSQQACFAGVLE